MSTDIEWAEDVANPTTGCDRTSPGCDNCYALRMAGRLKVVGQQKYQRDGDPRTSGPGFGVTEHPDVLAKMLRRRKPARVFLNSMSDIFHADVSDEFIARVFAVMALTPHVTYQVLTKRHGRMRSLLTDDRFRGDIERARRNLVNDPPEGLSDAAAWRLLTGNTEGPGGLGVYMKPMAWPLPNVWLGVSVEDQKWADIRIPALLETPAAVRWVSAEPLLGPIDFNFLAGISALEPDWVGGTGGGTGAPHPLLSWVVVGGESGPGAREMELAWANSIVADCQAAGVPVLVKQLGTVAGGKSHHDITTFPPELQVREYPA